MNDLEKIHHLYKLKQVSRATEVGNRRESSAEHTWSTMVLAEYFFPKVTVNRERARQLILFHDLVEIESGDTFVLSDNSLQQSKERAAFNVLKMRMPSSLAEQYDELFEEYEAHETIEAKFACAIDKLDPMIQNLYDKEIWLRYKFTEEKLRKSKEKYMVEFVVLLEFFNEIIDYMRENGYFDASTGS